MPWTSERSRDRIGRLMKSVPRSAVSVREFDAGFLQARRTAVLASGRRLGWDDAPIVNIATNEAILVDAVHVYVQLIDYHDALEEKGRETEASHRRTLQFLHLHYSATDRVVAEFEAQRVDYHGPRLHAVVVSPPGRERERERVLRALAMASTLVATVEAAGQAFGDAKLRTRVRIGMDTGMSVAVNSGRGSEPEPLFLGSPANYAAKLAEGDTPGIFASDRIRSVLGEAGVGTVERERLIGLDEDQRNRFYDMSRGGSGSEIGGRNLGARVQETIRSMRADIDLSTLLGNSASFRFHHHEPPLKTISFAELMPSNSVRMPLASVFADLSGFTAYVDESVRTGRVPEMTANLHVIRGELAACARDDFGGRKVRFIGDCLHGLVAEGGRTETDAPATVEAAIRLAGGLRSSFEMCREVLPGTKSLGIAIGVELGPTPVTRLGIRGDRSVRCASSKAVSASEAMQSELTGTQTAIGETAFASATARVRQLFLDGPAQNLDYGSVDLMLGSSPQTPAVVTGPSRPEFRAHGL